MGIDGLRAEFWRASAQRKAIRSTLSSKQRSAGWKVCSIQLLPHQVIRNKAETQFTWLEGSGVHVS